MPTLIPTHLSDTELIDALRRAAHEERGATALLIGHLAEMDARTLHLGLGFSSLFEYCLEVLRLSESATCKRIDVARAARRFPVLLDRLAEGALSLTSARLLAPHLTIPNHRELIAAAAGLRKRAVEEILARRFPKPDVVTLVRKLPTKATPPPIRVTNPTGGEGPSVDGRTGADDSCSALSSASPTPPTHPPSRPLPLATPLSADRYQIRFTASAATWEKLRVARDLLRHALPSGDAGEIFDRALTALIDELARKKLAVVKKPARPGQATAAGSRHIPAKVRRAVWGRDKGRCAFVAASGRRCEARGRLELHHVEPYAVGGPPTATNIELRCRAHNTYEAALFYSHASGPRRSNGRAEGSTGLGPASDVQVRPATHGLSARGSTGPGAGWASRTCRPQARDARGRGA